MANREFMEYDVVIVGAGPSGLACAIRIRQLCAERGHDLSVCVIEKGSEVGAHILSGAVLEPRALDELLPDWKERGAPLVTAVSEDRFMFLTRNRAVRLPTPPQMHNHGNYIISLGNFCRWLATQAEALGVEIYPGFAAAEVLYDAAGTVTGVATGDLGIGRDGSHTDRFQPGMELRARQTIFAEGCRGSLTRELFERFRLREGADPQTYGIGIKELWEIDPARHQPGLVIHSIGWPMSSDTSNEAAAARLRVALELFETGVEMKRQKLRRDHPDLSGDEIEARVAAWLRERPGAELGDAVGRPVTWPRDSG